VVRPGEVAVCRPDIVTQIDLPMAIEGAWYRPRKVFDRERVVVIFDHAIPSRSIKDVFFHIAQTWGGHGNTSVEYGGPGLRALAGRLSATLAVSTPRW
jgi:homoaconitase/3-isopropylmalate dehydratase large subunit